MEARIEAIQKRHASPPKKEKKTCQPRRKSINLGIEEEAMEDTSIPPAYRALVGVIGRDATLAIVSQSTDLSAKREAAEVSMDRVDVLESQKQHLLEEELEREELACIDLCTSRASWRLERLLAGCRAMASGHMRSREREERALWASEWLGEVVVVDPLFSEVQPKS